MCYLRLVRMATRRSLHIGFSALMMFACGTAPALGGVIAHWSFEDTGSTTTDSIGGRVLNLNGTTSRASGISGNALNFDGFGTASNMALGLFAGDSTQNITLSFWFNTTNWTSPGANPEVYNLSSTFLQNEGNRLVLYPNYPSTGLALDGDGATFPSVGLWYHSAFTIGGGQIKSYLNGALVDSQAFGGSLPASWLVLAGDSPSTSGFVLNYHGRIDEFKIYNEALSSTQINDLFNNPGGVQAVPEPTSLAIFALGALGCIASKLNRKRKC